MHKGRTRESEFRGEMLGSEGHPAQGLTQTSEEELTTSSKRHDTWGKSLKGGWGPT